MDISVRDTTKELSKFINGTAKQFVPRSIEFALNETAYKTSLELKKTLSNYIKNPTKYTERGIQYKKADARKRNFTSKVGFVSPSYTPFKKPPGKYPSEDMIFQ